LKKQASTLNYKLETSTATKVAPHGRGPTPCLTLNPQVKDWRVADRTYAQFCALAKALDVAGERWNLLIVRELLAGPKRYTDLLAGLPGISTDMLAARLRDLEAAHVIGRRTLPPPAASTVYELTDDGRDLERVVVELARWGLRRLGDKKRADAFRIEWVELTLRTMLRPEHAQGDPLVVDLEIAGKRLRVRFADGTVRTEPDTTRPTDVTVASDAATLAAIARDPGSVHAMGKRRPRITGSTDAIARLNRILGLGRSGKRGA
jgi:DNA-binding HxlR family transcriptional regulator